MIRIQCAESDHAADRVGGLLAAGRQALCIQYDDRARGELLGPEREFSVLPKFPLLSLRHIFVKTTACAV